MLPGQRCARRGTRGRRTSARRAGGAVAHALTDISDGLAVDAARLATRSRCKLVIDLEHVPVAAGATMDDLGFGEDYELLAATPDALPLLICVVLMT